MQEKITPSRKVFITLLISGLLIILIAVAGYTWISALDTFSITGSTIAEEAFNEEDIEITDEQIISVLQDFGVDELHSFLFFGRPIINVETSVRKFHSITEKNEISIHEGLNKKADLLITFDSSTFSFEEVTVERLAGNIELYLKGYTKLKIS